MSQNLKVNELEALEYHSKSPKGKLELKPTKPLTTQRHLSLAYSPGVAYACEKIAKDVDLAYEYTSKGNMVAVISNGTAVLGLGNLGAIASKPVMEGKAVLFKKFAGIDSFDIEVETEDTEEFIDCVKLIGHSWGGINLEDIKAPDCFIIEEKLKKLLDIPVFHDDQHGTAIITLAGLINAAELTGRNFEDLKVVVNGAGAASISCVELIKSMGVPHENVILCDSRGVIHKDRKEGMNQWKSAHAVDTKLRTLEEAMVKTDVFLGLSVKGAVSKKMVKSMNDNPIIFAMANPDPEITPEDVLSVRKDAIIATGRSDYNNQVNNVMGFPYIFRGALDVRATTINDEMKIAAAKAIAALARAPVPEEVSQAYVGKKMTYGPEYIIPVPFDPRLITTVAPAVASAAMKSGVARNEIKSISAYKNELSSRLDPTANRMNLLFERVAKNPQRIIFAEGEEEQTIRTAILWRDNGYGTPILVGREDKIIEQVRQMGIQDELKGIEISNAQKNTKVKNYIEYLYKKNQRNGWIYRDCTRLVKNDRNIFAACMLANGDGDALITGLTRSYSISLDDVSRVINTQPNASLFAYSMLVTANKTVYISDTNVNEMPTADQLSEFAIVTAHKAKKMGHDPRVAFLSFSNFGNPMSKKADRIREAVSILDDIKVDFEYDGEMAADVALNEELLKLYPFSRLTKSANVLIMPALHSANIASKLMESVGGGSLIGPILTGLEKPVQIVEMGAKVADLLNLAVIAANEAIDINDNALKNLNFNAKVRA